MKKIILTILFVLGIFICMLDTTIMNVSLPNIGEHLNIGLDSLSWALNVYLVLFAALTIPLTRLAEIFGIHKGFLLGVLLFGTGSILSALANGLDFLLVGRAVQSVGAALVFPLSMTLGINLVAVEKRTGMIAILGITQGIAAALGPTIGGIVTQFIGWRWIFLINVPLTVIMLIIGLFALKLRNEKQTKQTLDLWGSFLSMVFLSSLSLGMMQGRSWGWTSYLTITCFAVSLLGFILFLIVENRSKNPMVPLQLFANRSFAISSIIIILSELFLVATTVILPNYFTNIEGYDSLHASLLVAPISLAIFIFSPISGFARERISAKWLLASGFILMATGYVWLSQGALLNQVHTIVAGFLVGMGFGIITGPILVIAAGSLDGKLLTASQSVTGVLRQVGTMLAVAIFVTGLYGNLDAARSNSSQYAKTVIKKTHLPSTTQVEVLNQVHKKMNATQFVATDTSQLPSELANSIQKIENQTVIKLRNAFELLYLVSIPFVFLGALISLLLRNKDL